MASSSRSRGAAAAAAAEPDSDEDDYVFYGTKHDEEGLTTALPSGTKADPATLRSLPVHQQTATDEQGRKRFHGAFTGGFSAGYYNTVGSKVGTREHAYCLLGCSCTHLHTTPTFCLFFTCACVLLHAACAATMAAGGLGPQHLCLQQVGPSTAQAAKH